MTRTLDFSPELEARLQALAAQRGTTPDAAVLQVLEEVLPTPGKTRRRLLGAYAGRVPSVDSLHAEKREEAQREAFS